MPILKRMHPVAADVRVAHFCENFWGSQFLELPENVHIKTILEKAKRGLQITGKTRQKVAELLDSLLHTTDYQRIILLMEALNIIASCKELSTFHPLALNMTCRR